MLNRREQPAEAAFDELLEQLMDEVGDVDGLEALDSRETKTPTETRHVERRRSMSTTTSNTNPADVRHRFGRAVLTRFTDIARRRLEENDVAGALDAFRSAFEDDSDARDFTDADTYAAYRVAELRGRTGIDSRIGGLPQRQRTRQSARQ